jgi:hypothetical protein
MIASTLVLLVALSSAIVNMASAQTAGAGSSCVSCATRGVTSFFDGCNQCTCQAGNTGGTPTASCTKRACQPNSDPTVCTGKCDGFTVPSDDGCGSCTCKNGAPERCTASTAACRDPCSAVTCGDGKKCVADPKQCVTTPCPQFQCVVDDGSHKCGCNGALCKSSQGCANNGTCVNLPTQNWFADGAPFCVRGGSGRCCGDQFGASCGATDTCINGACVAASRVESACGTNPTSPCYTCKTPGVKSYFDGCNSCSCQNTDSAICTERACAAVLPDPKSCQMQCDGARSQDDGVCGVCLCIGGEKTQCSKCGVGSKCSVNSAGKPECVAVVPPKNSCADKPCASGETCIDEPKQCVTTPCPQYRCEKPNTSACASKPCGANEICTDEPKQCFTLPCPQYRCDKKQACGCDDPSQKCARGLTCQDNTCQPLPPVKIPEGAADGTPICLRAGGSCCGAGFLCGDDEVCEKNQCIKATQCAPPTNTCFTCKTPGVKSYSDGCNQCTCNSDGSASCTERACIALAHDPKQCVGHCDGFLTEDDGECGRCTCVGGEKTKCSKCGVGSGCKKDEATGKSKCVAVVPPPKGACDAKPCAVGETCIDEPKQCITTPCPQYRCEKNPDAGKCYSCDTPGVKSFFDGCNNCGCTENGALCTLIACIESLADPKQCTRQCDGFITEDDGQCGRCLCIGGKKTQCSNTKCTGGQPQPGTKCVSCDASEACKNAKVPKGDECNTCKCVDGKTTECTSRRCSAECKGVTKCSASGQICIGEPKQCITTPCDQFTCTDIGSKAALEEEQRFDDKEGAAGSMVASVVAIIVAVVVATM